MTPIRSTRVSVTRVPPVRRLRIDVIALAVWCVVTSLMVVGCGSSRESDFRPLDDPIRPADDLAIVKFCSGCHAMPNPETFAKDRWHGEVIKMVEIYRQLGKTDLTIPDIEATARWFKNAAPDSIAFEDLSFASLGEDLFERNQVPLRRDGQSAMFTAVSHAKRLASADQANHFAITDMGSGLVQLAELTDQSLDLLDLGRVAHPAHVEPSDLDQDGRRDFVVADLGGFFPEPHKHGGVWWLRPSSGDPENWERVPLAMGMMRVSDVRAGDFDNDGDEDLIVAEFGMYRHGGVYLMQNIGLKAGVPEFETKVLDDRPGGIHLPTVDLDGDGDLDFIALLSQQFESVVAFLNRGDATFTQEVIFEANNPAYGSSGIELVDMDSDGDVDVLMSNGDTFDDQLPKPVHSIQWLENRGGYPFTHHVIGQMPGAYRAVAGDVDGDGDVDVAAVSLLIDTNVNEYAQGTFDAVTYFQQTADGSFARYRLETDACNAATCNLVDIDKDGRLEIVVFPYSTFLQPTDSVTVFRFND